MKKKRRYYIELCEKNMNKYLNNDKFKKMYSKLLSIWKENTILEVENNFGDEFVLHE